jgi:hypothetical protein
VRGIRTRSTTAAEPASKNSCCKPAAIPTFEMKPCLYRFPTKSPSPKS